MKGTIRLGRIAGIDIGIHYSWFIIAGFVAWSLAEGFLPAINRSWSETTYWVTGILGSIFLFISVLIHELAHSLVAKLRGFEVGGITLFILGGVSNLRADARHARDEFIIAAVGPASSFVLSGIFWLSVRMIPDGPRTPSTAILIYLAITNLLLAVFNLLPAFPLDGGRVLRSIVWGATGNISKATKIAARGGQIVGFLMIGFGIYQVFEGNAISGVWMGIIGWFLQSVARASLNEYKQENLAQGIEVSEVMNRFPTTISPDATVYEAVYGNLWRYGLNALPVIHPTNQLVGIVTLADVRAAPTNLWAWKQVRHVMTHTPLWTVRPEDDLSNLIMLMERHRVEQVPVVTDDNRLVGMISRTDIIRHLRARGELDESAKRNLGIYTNE